MRYRGGKQAYIEASRNLRASQAEGKYRHSRGGGERRPGLIGLGQY